MRQGTGPERQAVRARTLHVDWARCGLRDGRKGGTRRSCRGREGVAVWARVRSLSDAGRGVRDGRREKDQADLLKAAGG